MIGNAIGTFFQRKKGKTGPVSGLSGVLGYWDTLGLTNEIMKENPVWKDKSEFKNDIRLNNIAWALSSGVGLYKMDFLNLTSNGTIIKHSSSKVEIKAGVGGLGAICYLITTYTKGINLFIQNKPDNLNLLFGSTIIGQVSLTNGINEIEISPTSQVVGFFCKTAFSELNIVIEQIPDYAGAICFDGIDDYGVCQSFPVVTKDKGYTVMALRRYISIPEKHPSGFISKFVPGRYGAFSVETMGSLGNKLTVSFAASTPVAEFPRLITYQTSKDFNGTPISAGSSEDTNELSIGKCNNYYGQFAIYALCIIDHDTTQEERQLVIDKWKRDFPELFPQHSWTVTGKTNDDEDRATIKDLTGNENNLALSNFAFAENSGYGLYAHNWNKWNLPAKRAEGTKQNNLVNITRVVSTSAVVFFFQTTDPSVGGMNVTIPSLKIRVSGLTDGQLLRYKFDKDSFEISEDGIYTLPSLTGAAGPGGYYFYGFFFTKIQDSCDITIEQIPDYEGYLVTDGVDDKIYSSPLSWGEDWTMVGNWKRIENVNKTCGIVAPNNLFIYIGTDGYVVYVKQTSGGRTIPTDQIMAICSDGMVYDENWKEYKASVGIANNISSIVIGNRSAEYCKIAFKNLAIYNRVLTKDQCIAGYNLLQTFKNS